MKYLLKYLLVFLILGVGFFVFNLLSATIPNKSIKKQLLNHIDTYDAIGDYDRPIINDRPYTFDYFTDAWIMNVAASIDNACPMRSSLLNIIHDKVDVSEHTRWHYLKEVAMSESLPEEHNHVYARYWLGASYFYRLFFTVSDYASLRIVLYLVSSLLLFTFLIRQYKLTDWVTASSFLIGLLLVNLMFMQYLIQFSSVLIISFVISIVIQTRQQKHNKDIGILFLLSGAFTNYFDLLTAPILSFGFPLLVWLSLQKTNDNKALVSRVFTITLYGCLWAFAYFGMFVFKWILVDIFTNFDIFSDVNRQAMIRLGVDADYDYWSAFSVNINAVNLLILLIFLVVSVAYSLAKFSVLKYRQAFLFFLVAFVPFLWIAFLNEHSYSHFWFTYRIMAISIIAILLSIISLRKSDRETNNI